MDIYKGIYIHIFACKCIYGYICLQNTYIHMCVCVRVYKRTLGKNMLFVLFACKL